MVATGAVVAMVAQDTGVAVAEAVVGADGVSKTAPLRRGWYYINKIGGVIWIIISVS